MVAILVKHGTDPNARDNWNFTPLHEAAIKGKVDVCISKGLGLEWDMYNYVYNNVYSCVANTFI